MLAPDTSYYVATFTLGVASRIICPKCASVGQSNSNRVHKGRLKCRCCKKRYPAHAHNCAYREAHALNVLFSPFNMYYPPEQEHLPSSDYNWTRILPKTRLDRRHR